MTLRHRIVAAVLVALGLRVGLQAQAPTPQAPTVTRLQARVLELEQQLIEAQRAYAALLTMCAPAPIPAKVYTNQDLVARPAPIPPRTEPPTTREAPPANRRDEVYWKGRMRALQTTLDDDRSHLRRSIELFDAVAADRSLVGHGRAIDAAAAMSRWTATVDTDRRAIADLHEEARRAGVPPGWLRLP